MGIEITSGICFLIALVGWVLVHHDLVARFPYIRSRLFLAVLGPVICLAGLVAVVTNLAEGGTGSLSRMTYYTNMTFAALAVYYIVFRPFRYRLMTFKKHHPIVLWSSRART